MEVPLLCGDDLEVVRDRTAGGDSRTPARNATPRLDFSFMDVAITTCPSSARAQLTVSTSALLFPPLVQPRSAEFPRGVSTVPLTAPGPEISPVVSFTVNFLSVTTFALRTFPLMTASDAATKLLPLTVTRTPCCTWAKVTVLGASDPIRGAGLALPQNGFRVLLPQPARNKSASRAAKDKPKVREDMVMLLMGWDWKGSPSISRNGRW